MDSYYDLDNGHKNAVSEGDIQFQVSSDTDQEYYLIPVNNAKAFFWGEEEPSQKDCSEIFNQMNIKKIFDLREGAHICLMTNEGNISRIKILDFQNDMIQLEFSTWKE